MRVDKENRLLELRKKYHSIEAKIKKIKEKRDQESEYGLLVLNIYPMSPRESSILYSEHEKKLSDFDAKIKELTDSLYKMKEEGSELYELENDKYEEERDLNLQFIAKMYEYKDKEEKEEAKRIAKLKTKTKIKSSTKIYAIKSNNNEYVTDLNYETEYLGHELKITPDLSYDIEDAMLFTSSGAAENMAARLDCDYDQKFKAVRAN